ncbi:MAG: ABC transporter permease [Alphaproteobacteria bacterium]|nr:ABC transporter permease [Alphaproteobacteria bacterium]
MSSGQTLRHVGYLGIKELRSLMRDPMMLFLIAYAFSFAIYAAATAMPETLNRAPIAIVDEDHSALSTRIIHAFYAPLFDPPHVVTPAEMDARLDAGLDTFALDIPPDFERDVIAGRRPAIQLNVDATRMTQAFTGSAYVQAIVAREIATFMHRSDMTDSAPVALILRARFNPILSKSWFGAVMEVINNVTMLSIILAGAALIREREHGTVEHLLVMPVTPFEIMASKVWATALVVLLSAALSLVVVVEQILSVPIAGSLPLFLAAAALSLFATTSMGIFLGIVGRSMPQFGLLLILVILPLEMLSGGMTPRESMPAIVRILMEAAPTTHFVALAQAVLYRGAGLGVVWPHMLALLVIGLVLFSGSLLLFRKRLRAMT